MSNLSAPHAAPRADIQALRAIAVLLVIVSHAWPDLLPGGFVGVDIFFVISGYLVAGALLERAARHEPLRIGAFFARRARRILPAASVVAVITTFLFGLRLDPLELRRYVFDGLAALFFVANFRAREDSAGYFSIVDPSPFRHYWSLGVEEQFYLLLPLFALACVGLRLRRRGIIALVVALSMLSLVGGWWLAQNYPALGFYMLPSRVWEFGVGAVAALLPTGVSARYSRGPGYIATIGIAGIVVSTALLTPTSLVPGPLLVPAVVGTALLLNVGSEVRAWWLPGWPPMRWVGDRSYALYLCHWPPLTWLLIQADGKPVPLVHTLSALILAFVSAALLHALIERPLHRGGRIVGQSPRRLTRLATSVAVSSVILVSAVPAFVRLQSDRAVEAPSASQVLSGALSNPGFVPADVTPALADSRELNGLYQGCHGTPDVIEAQPCEFGPPGEVSVVVVGDSHAANWYDAVLATYPNHRVAFVTRTNCPLYDPDPRVQDNCDLWRASALAYLVESRPQLTVLANYTSAYVGGMNPAAASEFESAWRSTLDQLAPLQRVVVLGDVPAAPFDPPRCLARHVDDARTCDFEPPRSAQPWNELERQVVESAGRPWVDTWPWFCDDRCAALAGNVAIWRDAAGHLTPEASRILAPRLFASLGALAARAGSQG